MRALTREWVAKAEGDFHTARREARVRQAPNYDAVCFHCQQSAEKYLKAFLQEQRQNFPRVHNLNQLLELCLPFDAEFELQRDLLKDLSKYAVEIRYPGDSANKDDARIALRTLIGVRTFMRRKLGLP
jgi:HEPN domain-containing protein